MVEILIFSKDRLMQLDNLIRSISIHWSEKPKITVMTPSDDLYREHLDDVVLSKVDRLMSDKASFNDTLRQFVRECQSENICFLVDDCVFFNHFDTSLIKDFNIATQELKQLYGMSLRLGDSTANLPSYRGTDYMNDNIPKSLQYWWVRTSISHFGYPFSVSADIYKTETVQELLADESRVIEIPNDFETYGNQWIDKHSKYCMFASPKQPACCACADLNRCQDKYPNVINGDTVLHSIDALNALYKAGWRIDTRKYIGCGTSSPFIGAKHFELKRK